MWIKVCVNNENGEKQLFDFHSEGSKGREEGGMKQFDREVKRGWLGSDYRETTSDSALPCSQGQTCLIWPATAHRRLVETHIPSLKGSLEII